MTVRFTTGARIRSAMTLVSRERQSSRVRFEQRRRPAPARKSITARSVRL